MQYQVKEEDKFKYYEAGQGKPLVLLHGLFGALSNFYELIDKFSSTHQVLVPMLPLFELAAEDTSVKSMVDYVNDFIEHKKLDRLVLLGNSLGGHIALLYVLQNPAKVEAIILTGSSGLFEESLGNSYPKKSDYEYIKEKTEKTFFDPAIATKELVDEVFEIVNNREKAIRVLYLAKSALRHNIKEYIGTINVPVLLIWGKDDTITPAFVGEEFHKHFPNSELHILDQCGHAPMMEKPEEFIAILEQFLNKLSPA
ncbi:MAG: alpha/beta hydrolase [Chitinophagales bacterium]|nr:alpha/beta hydrolase [Chitinophagales bacterium]